MLANGASPHDEIYLTYPGQGTIVRSFSQFLSEDLLRSGNVV